MLLVETPTGSLRRSSAPVWYLFWVGILAGPWITFGVWPGGRDALAYLVPLTAALLALPTRARTHRAGLAGDLACVLASFAVVTLPWLAFFWQRLGTAGFLREVLLLGSGAAQLYYVPYPAFEPWALLVTAAVAAFAVAGFALRARWVRPWQVGAAALVAAIASVAAIARLGVMPERTVWSLIWQLESAGYPSRSRPTCSAWCGSRHRASRGCEVPGRCYCARCSCISRCIHVPTSCI